MPTSEIEHPPAPLLARQTEPERSAATPFAARCVNQQHAVEVYGKIDPGVSLAESKSDGKQVLLRQVQRFSEADRSKQLDVLQLEKERCVARRDFRAAAALRDQIFALRAAHNVQR